MINHIKNLLKVTVLLLLATYPMTNHGMEITKSPMIKEINDQSIDWRRMVPEREDIQKYWLVMEDKRTGKYGESFPDDVKININSVYLKLLLDSVYEIKGKSTSELVNLLIENEKVFLFEKSSEDLKPLFSIVNTPKFFLNNQSPSAKPGWISNLDIIFDDKLYDKENIKFIRSFFQFLIRCDKKSLRLKITKRILAHLLRELQPSYNNGAACGIGERGYGGIFESTTKGKSDSPCSDDLLAYSMECELLINLLPFIPQITIEIFDEKFPNNTFKIDNKSEKITIFIKEYYDGRLIKKDHFQYNNIRPDKQNIQFSYVGLPVSNTQMDPIRRLIEQTKASSIKEQVVCGTKSPSTSTEEESTSTEETNDCECVLL